MSTTRTTDDRAVCPCQRRHLTRRRQLSHFLTHPRFNYHLDPHDDGDHGHHPGGAQQQPGQQLPFVDQDQDWGGRVWGGRPRGILVIVIAYSALVDEKHTHVAQVVEGEKGEQENRSPDEGAGALEEENLEQILNWKLRWQAAWTKNHDQSKTAWGVRNSMHCEVEIHFLRQVLKTAFAQTPKPTRHIRCRAPTFTFQTLKDNDGPS